MVSSIGRFYARYFMFGLPNKDVVLPCNGLQMLVRNPRESSLGRSVFYDGIWEPKAYHFISTKLKTGMTVLDVGAAEGYYTLLFAKHVGKNGIVYAFEPAPKAKDYLDKNIELNNLDNVRTLDFALSDKKGIVCLEDANVYRSHINPKKGVLSKNDVQVEMNVFDQWKIDEGIKSIDLIKIDVEGAELNVLKGMEVTLRNEHPSLFLEVHPNYIKRFGYTTADLMDYLMKFGYKFKPMDEEVIDFSHGNIHLFCQ